MKREIVLDTETTGLDPASGHRMIEIGCVEVIGGIRSGSFFHSYFNPRRDVPDEAFRIHGISGEFLKDKPYFEHKAQEFLEFIADDPLIIHNAGFDMRFINAELQMLGFPALPMERAIDTVVMARKKFPGAPASLDALCRRFEIDLGERTKHGALVDAQLLAEVYLELIGGRQVTFALDMSSASVAQVQAGDTLIAKRLPREFLPSEAEMHDHETMLAKLKNPLWEEYC